MVREETKAIELVAEGENDFVEGGSKVEERDERELDSGEAGKSSSPSTPAQWRVGYLIHHLSHRLHSHSDNQIR